MIDPLARGTGPYDRALEFLYDRLNYERQVRDASKYPFRLQRITELVRRLGLDRYLYPAPPTVPLVHLAGTKGKGSTATMVSAVLAHAGYRTGLYSSPHLHRLEERFRVNGEPCAEGDLVALVDRVRNVVTEMENSVGPPSFFELTTAMALLHFDSVGCEAVVLEVGLGGRLDGTNVCSPTVTAITSIGLDHQHVLGHTVKEIAAEKAGIIKPNVPVVSGVAKQDAMDVIRARAKSENAPLFQLGQEIQWDYRPQPQWGSTVNVSRLLAAETDAPIDHQIEVAMEGQHQARNAAVATAVVDLLRSQGMKIGETALLRGIAESRCEGRIERWNLPDGRTAIVDSAHNEDSIEALCQTLERRCASQPITVVFGTSIDKSAEPMLSRLADVASQFILTRFVGNPRYRLPQQLLASVPASIAPSTEVVDDPIAACQIAINKTPAGGVVVICGSFFLAAETRNWVQNQAV